MADQTTIDQVVSGLHWLGHDCFRLDYSGGRLYFDPFELAGGPRADLILITHEHFDHCVAEDVAKIAGPDTVILTERQCAAKLAGRVRLMKPGDVVEAAGVKATATPAYNTDKDFHPKANNWLGFVVAVDGVTIYHAGDTDHIPEMADLDVDVALLPVSGTYVMTAEQAAGAARAINPRLAIPMHYGAIVGEQGDAEKFAQALAPDIPVRVLAKEA
jgi:L-ascorbate metabolism protein UlaG (beta-lactamase superfamily)